MLAVSPQFLVMVESIYQVEGSQMSVFAVEGIVENGVIRIKDPIQIPEHTKVFVIVPGIELKSASRIMSPRLAHPDQNKDFKITVIEAPRNASL